MIRNQNLKLSKAERNAKGILLKNFPDERLTNYINQNIDRCLFDARFIAENFKNNKILNVGGVPFIFEVMLEHISNSIEQASLDIDPDHYLKQINSLNLNVIKCDFEKQKERNSVSFYDYDVICICELFEHMRLDLLGTFQDLYKKMKPNSFLYLSTPNFFYLPNLFGLLWTKRSGPGLVKQWKKLKDFGHMGHVREYSQIEVKELLEYCGFETVKIIPRNTKKYNHKKNPIKMLLNFFSELFPLFSNDFIILVKKN